MSYDDDDKPMVGPYRPKSRRCCIVSVLAVTLAVIVILAIAIPVGINNSKKNSSVSGKVAISEACQATSYPDLCNQTLSGSNGDPISMARAAIDAAEIALQADLNSLNSSTNIVDENLSAAVTVCKEVLQSAIDAVQEAVTDLGTSDSSALSLLYDDMKTDLSAAMEHVETCRGTLVEVAANTTTSQEYQSTSVKTSQLLSNALAFINALASYGAKLSDWKNNLSDLAHKYNLTEVTIGSLLGGRRRLLNSEISNGQLYEDDDLPGWMDSDTRRHLLAAPSSYNVVVAKDGSGKYHRVMDAINAAPRTGNKYAKRFTVYVKAGVYNEQIVVDKKLTNLIIIGDGQGRTIFTGSRSVALTKGMTTFQSATLVVSAWGFIGKFFTVQNTAGAWGHQACAVRVSMDRVAFYKVTMDGFQDTLYAHTFRHLYRECSIYGTVDFIFGNAAACFQKCQIVAKKTPLVGQQNTYTAQGKFDSGTATGISFQDCNFDATADLRSANWVVYPTYLGRPWKQYSTCVHLRSTLQGHISSQGWLPWNTSNFGLTHSFFAEYQSTGPGAGANLKKRVSWSYQIVKAGYATIYYQAKNFIGALSWLPSYGVPYDVAAV